LSPKENPPVDAGVGVAVAAADDDEAPPNENPPDEAAAVVAAVVALGADDDEAPPNENPPDDAAAPVEAAAAAPVLPKENPCVLGAAVDDGVALPKENPEEDAVVCPKDKPPDEAPNAGEGLLVAALDPLNENAGVDDPPEADAPPKLNDTPPELDPPVPKASADDDACDAPVDAPKRPPAELAPPKLNPLEGADDAVKERPDC